MAKARFIKSVTTAAKSDAQVTLPWTRGTRRAAFIAKRADQLAPRKTA